MLKPAALNSVQKSTFMCEGCAGKKYTITYTFGFREDNECRIVREALDEVLEPLEMWASILQIRASTCGAIPRIA